MLHVELTDHRPITIKWQRLFWASKITVSNITFLNAWFFFDRSLPDFSGRSNPHRTLSPCCILYVERASFRNLVTQIFMVLFCSNWSNPELVFMCVKTVHGSSLKTSSVSMYQIISSVDAWSSTIQLVDFKLLSITSQRATNYLLSSGGVIGENVCVFGRERGRPTETIKIDKYQILFSTTGRFERLVVVCRLKCLLNQFNGHLTSFHLEPRSKGSC